MLCENMMINSKWKNVLHKVFMQKSWVSDNFCGWLENIQLRQAYLLSFVKICVLWCLCKTALSLWIAYYTCVSSSSNTNSSSGSIHDITSPPTHTQTQPQLKKKKVFTEHKKFLFKEFQTVKIIIDQDYAYMTIIYMSLTDSETAS